MFTQLLERLTGAPADRPSNRFDDLEIAVAALLVQAALMDDVFEEAERAAIERLLAERFGLPGDAVKQLMAAAEDRAEQSNQLYAFTRTVMDKLDEKERIRVIEMLWEVAYADGILHPDEDALLRRVAGLIFVSDHDRGAARLRVLERLAAKAAAAEGGKEP